MFSLFYENEFRVYYCRVSNVELKIVRYDSDRLNGYKFLTFLILLLYIKLYVICEKGKKPIRFGEATERIVNVLLRGY